MRRSWAGGGGRSATWPSSSASSARTPATSASATSGTASRATTRAAWGSKTTSLIPVTNTFVIGINVLIVQVMHSIYACAVQVPLPVETALEKLILSQ